MSICNPNLFFILCQGDPMTWTTVTLHRPFLKSLHFNAVQRLVSYPFHGLYVVSLDSATDASPARLPAPELSDGPHLGYAFQWFCFAAIALIGAAIVVRRSRAPDADGSTGE